jgi:transaldolase
MFRTLPSPPNECSGLCDKWIIAHLHCTVQAKRGRDAESERKPSSCEAWHFNRAIEAARPVDMAGFHWPRGGSSGDLQRLIADDGATAVTGNPETFDRVIAESRDYDDAFEGLSQITSRIDAQTIYERIGIVDVRMAADALRTVFDRTRGGDGFASIGISPHLAHDTKASIAEARRLWGRVHRPNLMIKVPAMREGIPAIEALIGEGINVNVTLVFSLAQYEAVAAAYLRGIERAPDPRRTASVVSVPVSRIDSAVDGELLRIGTPAALSLRGKIAIANAKRLFRRFCNIFHSARFASLGLRGVHPQRMLWVSATTENCNDSAVHYVEELIGPDSVLRGHPKPAIGGHFKTGQR